VINHTHNLANVFSSLDENGADLTSLFKKLRVTVKDTFHIRCRLRLPAVLPPLPAEVTLQLYKIALESVSNAIRHAKATVVSISVVQEDSRLVMQIRNDGVPFPLYEEPGNRLGMRIMNYRAHTMDAELDVRPNGDTGTVVTCTWPLPKGVSNRAIIPVKAENVLLGPALIVPVIAETPIPSSPIPEKISK